MTFLLPWKRQKLIEIWTWPHISYLNILGMWAEEVSTQKFKIYFKLLRILNITFATLLCLSMLLSIILKFSDQDITKTIFATFMFVPLCFENYKLLHIIRHRKSLKRAMDLLDELLHEITDPEYMVIIREKLTHIWIIFIISSIAVCFVTIHWYLRPLLYVILFGQKTIILEAWPVFIDTWLQFSFTYIFQVLGSFPLAIGFNIFDSIYFCISELILCHCEILEDKLEKWNVNTSNLKSLELKNLVKVHITLLEICKNMQTASETILIMQTLICILTNSFGLFILILGENVSGTLIINIIETLSTLTLFLYLLCRYSNEITVQTYKLGTSAYMSDWINGNEIQKKILLNLMTKTETPIIFGGFMKINLESFINIMKMTFSYYNLLLAVTGKHSH